MQKKWPYLIVVGLVVGGTWYFFSDSSQHQMSKTQNKQDIKRTPASQKRSLSQDITSSSAPIPPKEYFEILRSDPGVERLYVRSKELFRDSPHKEELATWVSIGLAFDSSPEYGELLNGSLDKINQSAVSNFAQIEQVSKNLSPEDSFIRGQLINLVNQMNVSKKDKVKYFGSEMARGVTLDSEGRFSPDSLNITTAMIMLKNNGVTKKEAKEFINESLQVNSDPEVKEKLVSRFNAYF